jgi:hypothetical protein
MTPELRDFVFGSLIGLIASSVFLLALFIGFCVVFGFPKLRRTGRASRVHRSLEEMVGQEQYARYLPPDAPRGPADQLRTPELLEAAARKPV